MAKNHFFSQKKIGQPTKRNFELKMLKLHENNLLRQILKERQISKSGFLIF